MAWSLSLELCRVEHGNWRQFQFQTVHDKKEQLARLRPVLPVNATVSDMGSIGSARFLHDYLSLKTCLFLRRGLYLHLVDDWQ